MKLFFLIFSIFCIQSGKAGFGSFIGSFFNDCIDEATSNLVGKVKQALIESMDVLFDKKITPMIHEIEATSNRVMDHTKDDVNAVVDNFKTQIQSLVDDAVKNAESFVDHSVEEIKENILQNAFDNLNNFEDKLQQDLNSLLNKVDAIIF
jgi:hypothetical protein